MSIRRPTVSLPAGRRRRIHAFAPTTMALCIATLLGSSSTHGESKQLQESPVRVIKTSAREIEVTGTFSAGRAALFDAITRPEHLKQWMSAGGMALAEVHVDPRADGSFRYVFSRPNGMKIEVRGAYSAFDVPRGFAYLESYDFSPLRIEVTTSLEESGDSTKFTQRLRYFSTKERDEDFDGVATSSREAYANLARYLATRKSAR
jgi:uncharacterized protein YndB with AHSA1/START domain